MNIGTFFQPIALLQPGTYQGDSTALISPLEDGNITYLGNAVPLVAGEVIRCAMVQQFSIDVEFRCSNRLEPIEAPL